MFPTHENCSCSLTRSYLHHLLHNPLWWLQKYLYPTSLKRLLSSVTMLLSLSNSACSNHHWVLQSVLFALFSKWGRSLKTSSQHKTHDLSSWSCPCRHRAEHSTYNQICSDSQYQLLSDIRCLSLFFQTSLGYPTAKGTYTQHSLGWKSTSLMPSEHVYTTSAYCLQSRLRVPPWQQPDQSSSVRL